MKANSVVPRNFGVPILLAQGSADLIVSAAVTHKFVAETCRAGQPVQFLQIAGGDHITIAKRTADTTIDWFAERPVPDDCGRL